VEHYIHPGMSDAAAINSARRPLCKMLAGQRKQVDAGKGQRMQQASTSGTQKAKCESAQQIAAVVIIPVIQRNTVECILHDLLSEHTPGRVPCWYQ